MAKSKKVTANLENSVQPAAKAEDPIDNYEVQNHLETLTKAHGIMNDPAKMAKVHKLAGRHGKAIAAIKGVPAPDDTPAMKSIQDVKDYAQKKYGPKSKSSGNSLAALKDNDQDGE